VTVKYIYLLSALFGLLLPMAVRAQNVLTAEEHALRPCDKTERLQTEFFDVGNPGTGGVWDFSTLDTSSRKTITEYLGGTDSTVVEAAPHSIRKYVLRNDSLFLCAYRNRLYDIEYSVPVLEMVYPMQFGDTLYTYYSGNGLYSGKRQVETAGEARVSADAYGTLVMPSGDTLRNVVRIYTLNLYPKAYIYYPGDKKQKSQLFQYDLDRSKFDPYFNPNYKQIKHKVYK
jgi:hypothetical protein